MQPTVRQSLAQIGDFDSVMSHVPNSPIQLTQDEKSVVAALQTKTGVLIITTDWSSSAVFSVISKLERSGYTVDDDAILPVTDHLFKVIKGLAESAEEIHRAIQSGGDNEALKQFRNLLERAVLRTHPASDIHAQFDENNGQIKLRINGFLERYLDMLLVDAKRIFGAAWYTYVTDKAKEAGSSFQPDQPQAGNGRIQLSNGEQVMFRWQSKPADLGFDIVIRLLYKSGEEKLISLEEAGYHEDQLEQIYAAANSKGGAIIISGDTGSGKSTTLASMMRLIHTFRPKSALVSLENPREYDIPNVRQTTVNDGQFADWLKVMLRSDYETLMTGEVRTEEEVKGFSRSIMAGHQGLTTIHTADAMTIIQRLEDLGVPRDILGSKKFLNLLVHQYLVPVLCQHCAKPFLLSDEAKDTRLRARLKDAGIDETKILGHGNGCSHCQSEMGVMGRTVVAEVIRPTHIMKKYIAAHQDAEATEWLDRHYSAHPILGKPAIAHAIYKIKHRITSPQLVEYCMGNLNEELLERGAIASSITDVMPLDEAIAKFQESSGDN